MGCASIASETSYTFRGTIVRLSCESDGINKFDIVQRALSKWFTAPLKSLSLVLVALITMGPMNKSSQCAFFTLQKQIQYDCYNTLWMKWTQQSTSLLWHEWNKYEWRAHHSQRFVNQCVSLPNVPHVIDEQRDENRFTIIFSSPGAQFLFNVYNWNLWADFVRRVASSSLCLKYDDFSYTPVNIRSASSSQVNWWPPISPCLFVWLATSSFVGGDQVLKRVYKNICINIVVITHSKLVLGLYAAINCFWLTIWPGGQSRFLVH